MTDAASPDGGLRSLVVSLVFPWPVTAGVRIRLENTVEGLAALGPVELVSLVAGHRLGDDDPCVVPDDAPVTRATVVARPSSGTRLPVRVLRSVATATPLPVSGVDWAPLRVALAEAVARHRPDVVWFQHATPALGLGLPAVPSVVDFDDLEDGKVAGRLALATGRRTPRRLASHVLGTVEQRAWRRSQQDLLGRAAAAVVCSPADAARLDSPRVHVVPNGVTGPAGPVPARAATGRRIVFHGSFTYEPNIDGARFLVEEVMPALWARRHDAQLRLVGRADDRVLGLADGTRVVTTGFVDSMSDELAAADVVVVPVRYGGGTRIKAIEAFAHGRPVVGTTVGLTGLGAEHGRDVLVADDGPGLAAAIDQVLGDPGLASRLGAAGRVRFEERFTSEAVRRAVGEVAVLAAAAGAS